MGPMETESTMGMGTTPCHCLCCAADDFASRYSLLASDFCILVSMADRSVHYEAAFEAFLRGKGIPYVAVDEAKKALFANAKLKSFDFVVYPQNKPRLLVDVKGRSLRNRAKRSGFETWATEADVKDLLQWEQVFGEGFTAVFGFVYWIDPPLPGTQTAAGGPG